jgi:hypothetical protein
MIQDEMVNAMRDDRSLGCSELSRFVPLMPVSVGNLASYTISSYFYMRIMK